MKTLEGQKQEIVCVSSLFYPGSREEEVIVVQFTTPVSSTTEARHSGLRLFFT